eukprot:COSAG02_NODE_2942_length_7692_cov_3.853154_11_plen_78_part_00
MPQNYIAYAFSHTVGIPFAHFHLLPNFVNVLGGALPAPSCFSHLVSANVHECNLWTNAPTRGCTDVWDVTPGTRPYA